MVYRHARNIHETIMTNAQAGFHKKDKKKDKSDRFVQHLMLIAIVIAMENGITLRHALLPGISEVTLLDDSRRF